MKSSEKSIGQLIWKQNRSLSLFIVGRLLSFVGLAIELSIAGSHAAEEAGFQLSASGSKSIPSI